MTLPPFICILSHPQPTLRLGQDILYFAATYLPLFPVSFWPRAASLTKKNIKSQGTVMNIDQDLVGRLWLVVTVL